MLSPSGDESMMESVQEKDWDDLSDEDLEAMFAEPDPAYIDAIDKPPCPLCGSSEYDLDRELHAYVCDSCGLWRTYHEDTEDLPEP